MKVDTSAQFRRSRTRTVRCTASSALCPENIPGGRRTRWSRWPAWRGWSLRSRIWRRPAKFYTDFGFTVAGRTPETLLLRGRWAGAACLVVRRGPHSRFTGTAYQAAAREDLDRLARGTGGTVTAPLGGHDVVLGIPAGSVRVIATASPSSARCRAGAAGAELRPGRSGSTLRSGRCVGRRRSTGWACGAGHHPVPRGAGLVPGHPGLIVSDFLYLDGSVSAARRWRPSAATTAASPPTTTRWPCSCSRAPSTCTRPTSSPTLMGLAASGEYLRERGYRHAWGIGLDIQGSQIFDYWRDRDRLMFEHYADGDMSTPRRNRAARRCRSAGWPVRAKGDR